VTQQYRVHFLLTCLQLLTFIDFLNIFYISENDTTVVIRASLSLCGLDHGPVSFGLGLVMFGLGLGLAFSGLVNITAMSSFHHHFGPVTNLVTGEFGYILGRRSPSHAIVKVSNTDQIDCGIPVRVSSEVSVAISLVKCEKSGRSVDYCNVLLDRQSHQVVIVGRSSNDNVLHAVPRKVVDSDEEVIFGIINEQLTALSGHLSHAFRQIQQRVVA